MVRKVLMLFFLMIWGVTVVQAQNEESESEEPLLPEYFNEDPRIEPQQDKKSQRRARRERGNLQDTIIITTASTPDPIKAALLSAVLPGLGQVYNKSYVKVPVVYGALMTTGYLVHYFDYHYIKYRNAFLADRDGNPATMNPYADDWRVNNRLFDRVEFYRRNRDYLMIITAGFYLLNIVEAHVDAHLQTFDLSDDITMNIRPGIISTPYATQFGLSININFK